MTLFQCLISFLMIYLTEMIRLALMMSSSYLHFYHYLLEFHDFFLTYMID